MNSFSIVLAAAGVLAATIGIVDSGQRFAGQSATRREGRM